MQDSVHFIDQQEAASSATATFRNKYNMDAMSDMTQALLPQTAPAAQAVRTVTVVQTVGGGFLKTHGAFCAQVSFSLLGAVFACGMLWRGEDAGKYLPVLTGIIGYWVPSPKSSSKAPAAQSVTEEMTPSAPALPSAPGSTAALPV